MFQNPALKYHFYLGAIPLICEYCTGDGLTMKHDGLSNYNPFPP